MRTQTRATAQNNAETSKHLTQLTRIGWHRTARKLAACATCAVLAGSLAIPNLAFAADWVDVDGMRYDDKTTGASGEGWSWDGADDMTLDGYNGGSIYARGDLNISYRGENTVTAEDPLEDGIGTGSGADSDGKLTITGEEGSSLNVSSTTGNAIYANDGLTITGGGTIEATSSERDAIWSNGDAEISESTVIATATGERDVSDTSMTSTVDVDGIYVEGTTKSFGNAHVTAKGTCCGISSEGQLIIDNAEVTADATNEDGEVDGLMNYVGGIIIRGKSVVKATATGSDARGIRSEDDEESGGHISISDSTVTATASTTYDDGYAVGIEAGNFNADAPASIKIVRSNVIAAGNTAALYAYTFQPGITDNGRGGTIEISDSRIVDPSDASICDVRMNLREEADDMDIVLRGQVIGTADDLISDLSDPAVSTNVTIEADKEPEPEQPGDEKPGGDADKGSDSEAKGANGNGTTATVTQASAKKQGGKLPQTGDANSTVAAATLALAGVSAAGAGIAISRKRQ